MPIPPLLHRVLSPTRVVFLAGVVLTLYLQSSIEGLGFANGDAGLKFLMTRQFAGGGLSRDLRLPAEPWMASLWKKGLYPVPAPNVIEDHGRKLPGFPLAFPFMSALPYLVFGFRGLYLLPLFGLWLVWLAFLRACRALGVSEMSSAFALATLAFGTPLTFYSATFWEHTPAVALAFGGLCLALVELLAVPGRPSRCLVGGILVGLAPLLREELFLVAALLAGVSAVIGSRPGFAPRARAFLAGVLGGTLLVLLSNLVVYQHPLGLHASVALRSSQWADPGAAIEVLGFLTWSLLTHFPLAAVLPLGVLAVWWKSPLRTASVAAGLVVFAAVISIATPVLVQSGGGRSWGPRFLLVVFPLLCLAMALLLDAVRAAQAGVGRRLALLGLAAVALVGARKNTIDAAGYLFRNYADRMASLRVVEASSSRVVAISHESVGLQLASLMGPRQFVFAPKGEHLRSLARAAAGVGYERFLYVCYKPYGCGRLEDEARHVTFFRLRSNEPLIEFDFVGEAGRYIVYEARIGAALGAALGAPREAPEPRP